MTFDPEFFRLAMRAWTTGVAVLMAAHENESYGMTINSFTSLSLDPPLVTVVLKNDTRIFDLVSKSLTAFQRDHSLQSINRNWQNTSPGNCTG